MNTRPLSLCMVVKNVEDALARCLMSTRDLDPEIIVVDTGSTDGTAQLAAHWKAKVIPFEFTFVDFSAARNCALSQASGRWIVVLDADETLQPDSLGLIENLIRTDREAGYYFERVNHYADPGRVTTDYVVRLFPNRELYRYTGRVHETIDASILNAGGRLLRSGIRIDHQFASNPEERRQKNLWYIEILNQEIAANPWDCSRLTFLAAEYHQLGMYEKAAEIAEKIAILQPRNARAHLHAGVYHLFFKVNLQQARADFQEALRLKPGDRETLSFLEVLDQRQPSLCPTPA